MRSFLRNRRFKNFASKIDVLCSCLLLNSKAQIVCVTGTTNDVGIVTVYGKFAVSKAYCLSNVASQLTTPYRITVDSISSTNLRLRIRDIATNKALANADLPKFDVLIVGK